MFSALIEATSSDANGRRDGVRHTIIAIVAGAESACLPRAIDELQARGWRDVQIKRVGPVMPSDAGATPGYLGAAIADAEESGFGLVVYEKPTKAS